MPTSSELKGVNTIKPLCAVVALLNLRLVVILSPMSRYENKPEAVSKIPIQSAEAGARTTRPLCVTAAPENLHWVEVEEDVYTVVKALSVCEKWAGGGMGWSKGAVWRCGEDMCEEDNGSHRKGRLLTCTSDL